jgi:hypothetical protein
MKTLCIVPCGKRKIWDKFPDAGPQEAKDVYIGPYASKCIQYAQIFYPESWCILSAKFGFLLPNDIVPGSYNITFKEKKTRPISKDELFSQIRDKGLYKYDKIIVLGGKTYAERIDYLFEQKTILKPLYGCRIGEALRKLNEAISTGVPLQ